MNSVAFNEQVAQHYDKDAASMFQPDILGPNVDFLEAFVGDGAALEFGIGTGRVALPLSARGVSVHGIDISEPILKKLLSKPDQGKAGKIKR